MRMVRCLVLAACLGAMTADLLAQEDAPEPSDQVWLNMILSRSVSDTLYLEYDIEAAKQVSGDGDPWKYLYGTGLVEYYPSAFVDLTGELVTGFTEQDSEEDSIEATVRLGARFHLISQIINSPYFTEIRPERMTGKRLSISNLARFEYRNFWYDGDRPSADDLRFRNRIEFKCAFNRDTLTSDGVWYGIADVEWFVNLSDEKAAERFATKRRYRLGVGFRPSYQFRYELVAMRDYARETLDEEGDVDANMINFRFKWFF